jgi:hypothetical protein
MNGKEYVQVFYCWFITVDESPIVKKERWDLTSLCSISPHFLPVPSQDLHFQSHISWSEMLLSQSRPSPLLHDLLRDFQLE